MPAKIDVEIGPLNAKNAIPRALGIGLDNQIDIESLTSRVSTLEINTALGSNALYYQIGYAVLVNWARNTGPGAWFNNNYSNTKKAFYYESNTSAPIPRPSNYAGKSSTFTFGGYDSEMSEVTENALLLEAPAVFNGQVTVASFYFGASKFLFVLPYPDGIDTISNNDTWSVHFSYKAASLASQ